MLVARPLGTRILFCLDHAACFQDSSDNMELISRCAEVTWLLMATITGRYARACVVVYESEALVEVYQEANEGKCGWCGLQGRRGQRNDSERGTVSFLRVCHAPYFRRSTASYCSLLRLHSICAILLLCLMTLLHVELTRYLTLTVSVHGTRAPPKSAISPHIPNQPSRPLHSNPNSRHPEPPKSITHLTVAPPSECPWNNERTRISRHKKHVFVCAFPSFLSPYTQLLLRQPYTWPTSHGTFLFCFHPLAGFCSKSNNRRTHYWRFFYHFQIVFT